MMDRFEAAAPIGKPQANAKKASKPDAQKEQEKGREYFHQHVQNVPTDTLLWHPNLLLDTLGIFELGLAPQRLGTPVRDAFVMAIAFGVASLVPLLPFLFGRVLPALAVSGALTLIALFIVGIVKARVAGVSALRSGLEVAVLAAASGGLSFGLGRLASLLLGVDVH